MRRRARIANRRPGGLWWKVPLALALWLVFATPVLVALAALIYVQSVAADLPLVPDLDRWDESAPRTSVILAADGTILAELPFRAGVEVGHRLPVTFADLPSPLVRALLAAEDARFFEHTGVDAKAVVRAAITNYRAGRIVEGASTITQQVARNLLPETVGRERTIVRKIREALMARRIERRFSKDRIFEVYANHVFLGAGAYGVSAASRAYFSKPLADLDLPEAALIAGLAQAPGRTDPYKDKDAAKVRRDEVLERMAKAGFITADAAEAARSQPIALVPPPLRYGTLAPWHTEAARHDIETAMPRAYEHGGLVIETTAQPALAQAMESQARGYTETLGKDLPAGTPEVAALIWDTATGYLEGMVGGRAFQDSQFNRATQACRQPGSAFKPILYTAALEAEVLTPGTPLRDAPIAEYDEELNTFWKPQSGSNFRGVVLAQDALALSLNAPAVYVLDLVGAARVADLAQRLGITTKLADVRPLALGASCVIPLELTGAFAVFARGGTRAEHILVTRVHRGDAVFFDHASPYDPMLGPARRLDRLVAAAASQPERVLDRETAYLITDMLRDVVRRGTATLGRRLGRDMAGKTGTTNDNTDAWFVGFTGRVVAAVWLGYDNPATTLGPRDDGARAALPLWMRLVDSAEAERPPVAVPGDPPATLVRARVDRETGRLAQPGAGGAVDLYFRPGTEPIERAGHVPGSTTDLGRLSREF